MTSGSAAPCRVAGVTSLPRVCARARSNALRGAQCRVLSLTPRARTRSRSRWPSHAETDSHRRTNPDPGIRRGLLEADTRCQQTYVHTCPWAHTSRARTCAHTQDSHSHGRAQPCRHRAKAWTGRGEHPSVGRKGSARTALGTPGEPRSWSPVGSGPRRWEGAEPKGAKSSSWVHCGPDTPRAAPLCRHRPAACHVSTG